MKRAGNIVCFILLILGSGSMGQTVDILKVLDSSRAKISRIDSYTADAVFKVDIDFVRMPDKNARIHFKAPDKIDIESDGFLMVPKAGIKPMLKQLDIDRHHALYVGEEVVNNEKCYVAKMIPKNRNNKIVFSTLWIRADNYLVSRWEFFTKKSGSMLVEFQYDSEILPAKMIFSFEVDKMNLPLKYFGNDVEIESSGMQNGESQEGKVVILFENYRINYFQDATHSKEF